MRDYRLWLLFTTALLLRFFSISSESLWLDEGLSVRLAAMPLADINSIGLQTDHNPPLYLYLLHFWIKLFGSSEFAVRSLSAILNAACIIPLWLVVARLFNSKVAFISVLIFTLSPFQIYYAQETRAYSLLCLTSLTAILAFIYLRVKPNASTMLLAILCFTLLLYTHIYAWFTLLFLNLCFMLDRDHQLSLKQWLIVQFSAFIAYLPYAQILFELVIAAQQGYWLKKPGLLHLASSLVYFTGSVWIFAMLVWGFLFGLYFYKAEGKSISHLRRPISFLLLWIFIPLLVPFLLSQVISPFFLSRYAIAASPGLYILFAFGIQYIPTKNKQQRTALQLIAFCSVLIIAIHFHKTVKEPWREAIQELKAVTNEEDPIFVGSAFCIDEMFGYYWPECKTAIGLERKTVSEDVQKGMESLKEDQAAWFVSSHFERMEEKAIAQFEEVFKVKSYRDYYHWDMFGREIRAIRIFKLTQRDVDMPVTVD